MSQQEKIIESEVADPVNIFYSEWGKETLKQVPKFLSDTLRLLVTLNTTLLGGSLFFLECEILDPVFKAATMLCFLISLIVSVIGLMPYSREFSVFCADEVRAFKTDMINHRSRFLCIAFWLMIIGFVLALAGVFHRIIMPLPYA